MNIQSTQIGIEDDGHTITVANDPRARLMYYFNCACSLLGDEISSETAEYRDYRKYYNISTNAEIKTLIDLAYAARPERLEDVVFFHSESIESDNKFVNITATKNQALLLGNIAIAG